MEDADPGAIAFFRVVLNRITLARATRKSSNRQNHRVARPVPEGRGRTSPRGALNRTHGRFAGRSALLHNASIALTLVIEFLEAVGMVVAASRYSKGAG